MTAHFINPLIQHGRKQYDLLLIEEESIIERFHMNFKDSDSDEIISNAAKSIAENLEKEITKIIIDKPYGSL